MCSSQCNTTGTCNCGIKSTSMLLLVACVNIHASIYMHAHASIGAPLNQYMHMQGLHVDLNWGIGVGRSPN